MNLTLDAKFALHCNKRLRAAPLKSGVPPSFDQDLFFLISATSIYQVKFRKLLN